MSYLALDPNEQNTGAANQAAGVTTPGQPINPSQGGSSMVGGGAGAGKGGPSTGLATPSGGGGFTNLGAYLQANQGGGRAANGVLQQDAGAVKDAANAWQGQETQAINAGSPSQGAVTSAEAAASKAHPGGGGGLAPTVSYTGPTPAGSNPGFDSRANAGVTTALQGLAGDVKNAQGSPGGYQALANKFGGSGLSAALVGGANPGQLAANATGNADAAWHGAEHNVNQAYGNAQQTVGDLNKKLAGDWSNSATISTDNAGSVPVTPPAGQPQPVDGGKAQPKNTNLGPIPAPLQAPVNKAIASVTNQTAPTNAPVVNTGVGGVVANAANTAAHSAPVQAVGNAIKHAHLYSQGGEIEGGPGFNSLQAYLSRKRS